MKDYLKIIRINEKSMVPKYRQLADAILEGIASGHLAKEEGLPSIHDFSTALDISKNSVEKAYNTLKNKGIVGAFKGKGYFVIADKIKHVVLAQ